MLSERQLNANRRNAQLSTGPRTPEGRAAISQNALRHGLASKTAVLPTENPEEFRELRDSFFDEHQPSGPTETLLVEQMAMAAWRLRRLRALETGLFNVRISQLRDESPLDPRARALANDMSGSRSIEGLSRYETRIERSFYRALHQLEHLRSASLENNAKNQTHSRNRTPDPAAASALDGPPQDGAALTVDPLPDTRDLEPRLTQPLQSFADVPQLLCLHDLAPIAAIHNPDHPAV